MDRAKQVALMQRIFGFLDRQTTELVGEPYVNRVSTYTSGGQLERERERLFRGEPLLLGLSSDAEKAGAYFAHVDTGVPILVVRTRTGSLQAFVGLCRHRGATLASGYGSGSGRFSCPYHGWTYDDHGRLVSQPCSEGFAGIPTESLGLTALPVVEKYGLIFVRPSTGDGIDIDQHLGGAQHELASLGLGAYVRFGRHPLRVGMNWKLAIDTFLEAYHVSSLHKKTLRPTILGAPAAWDAFGRCSRMVAVRRSIEEVRQRPESEWNLFEHSVVLYQIFPNTMLIYQMDHVEVVQAYPDESGPDSSRVVFTLYTPAAVTDDRARRHFQRNFDLLLEVTEREDFHLGEQIQRGFHVDGHDTVIYGRNEPGLAHYHRMIKAALGEEGQG
jgi:phenylpropionate dioxygenase-like ring-hydroxylating dioxygenase large terminal subunit